MHTALSIAAVAVLGWVVVGANVHLGRTAFLPSSRFALWGVAAVTALVALYCTWESARLLLGVRV